MKYTGLQFPLPLCTLLNFTCRSQTYRANHGSINGKQTASSKWTGGGLIKSKSPLFSIFDTVYPLSCPCVPRCRYRRSTRSTSVLGGDHWGHPQSHPDQTSLYDEITELKMTIADLKREIKYLEFTTLVDMKDSLASMEKVLAAKDAGRGEDYHRKKHVCMHACSKSPTLPLYVLGLQNVFSLCFSNCYTL